MCASSPVDAMSCGGLGAIRLPTRTSGGKFGSLAAASAPPPLVVVVDMMLLLES